MIKLRPWKGTKNEFEADIIVNGPNGRTLRKRVKAPLSGKSNAERWARSLEQELFAQILAPEPEPAKLPAPTFEEFAVRFLELCKANRLGVNTLMNYEVHLRLYLVPVLARRRLDEVRPADIHTIKASLASKARSTMTEVLNATRAAVRPLTTTSAFSCASSVAIAKPIPAVEPVTKMRLPANCRFMGMPCLRMSKERGHGACRARFYCYWKRTEQPPMPPMLTRR